MEERKVELTLEEAKEALGWLAGYMDEYGGCSPEDGKCRGQFNHLDPRCKTCARLGIFLGVEYRYE